MGETRPAQSTALPRRLWILTAAVTVIGAQALVPSILLVDISDGVGLRPAVAGVIFGLYGLALAMSSLAAGARLERMTLRTRVSGGLAALAAGLVVVGCASDGLVLSVGVFIAGTAAGVALPAVYALVPNLVGADRLSRAMSRVLLGWALSLVVGVPAAGLIAQWSSWREAFIGLAALALVASASSRVLPSFCAVGTAALRFRSVLSDFGLRRLLGGVVAFMATFYGVFAFVGTDARAQLTQGDWLSSAVALAYGSGFATAGALHRWTERLERSLLPLAFTLLIALYALLPFADRNLLTTLAAAAVWGFVNETALTMLVVRISRGPRGAAALALYNSVTYVSAAIGTTCASAVFAHAGFVGLGLCAAAVCALGLIAVASSSRPPQDQLHPVG